MIARLAISIVLIWLHAIAFGAALALTIPVLSGRVVDEAKLLTPAEIASLTTSLADLESRTNEQFVVVTLRSLQGTTIEDFGYHLGRQWKIGQKGENSGVLLIVAAAERKVRIEVGYGLEHKLTDAVSKAIIEREIVPAFRIGDYAGGIENGTAEIVRILSSSVMGANDSDNQKSASRDVADPTIVWLVILFAAGGVVFLIHRTVNKPPGTHQKPEAPSRGRQQQSERDEPLLSSEKEKALRVPPAPFRGGGGTFGGGGSSGSW